jgi:hypothetical protein
VLIGCGVIVVAIAVVVEHFHLLDRGAATPLSIEEARDRYRDSTSTTSAAVATTNPAVATTGPEVATTSTDSVATSTSDSPATTAAAATTARLPDSGVYVYATTGRDSVDALNGDHHDYPETTTITVSSSDCGVLQRWDVLVQRWEEWQRCADGSSVREPSRTTFDEFFGQSQTDSFTCTGDPRPVDAPPGTTWTTSCAQDADIEISEGVVVGTEDLTVGTSTVSTLHVRVTVTNEPDGDKQVTETWYQVGTDLVIAQTGEAATSNPSPVGTVHYTENYEIHLTSLTPLT